MNVRGLADKTKLNLVLRKLLYKHDIICLQETHLTNDSAMIIARAYPDILLVHSFGTSNSRGVLIAIKKARLTLYRGIYNDNNGRVVSAQIKFQDQIINIICTYAPNLSATTAANNDYNDYLDCVDEAFEFTDRNDSTIWCGDFNLIMNPILDAYGGKPTTYHNQIDRINDIKNQYDLSDIFRKQQPNENITTYRRKGLGRRLDYMLVTRNLFRKTSKCMISPFAQSDHDKLTLELESKNTMTMKAPRVWRYHPDLKLDGEYKMRLTNEYENWSSLAKNDFPNDFKTQWDQLKCKIRNFTQKYMKEKALRKRATRLEIESEMNDLHKILSTKADNDAYDRMEELKRKLTKIESDHCRELSMKARVQYYEEGERNTRFFHKTIAERRVQSNIYEIEDNGGNTVDEREQVSEVIHDFYKNLFDLDREVEVKIANNDTKLQTFLAECEEICNDEREQCESDITNEDIEEIIESHLTPNKSPGNDGLTSNFYKERYKLIKDDLYNALKQAIEEEELSESQKQSTICLLLKKGKNRMQMGSYRPISLMQVDAKILARFMAMKLEKTQHSIIEIEQNAYIRGRFIGNGIKMLQLVREHVHRTKSKALMVSVDIRKAFDSVSHEYMQKVFEKHNYGPKFRAQIRTLYKGAKTCATNQGYTTNYWPLRRSVKQGCPFSAVCFLNMINPLIRKLKKDPQVKGVTIRNIEYKINAFADDITLILKDEASLQKAMKIIKDFGEISGLKTNQEKTEIMAIGNWQGPVRIQGYKMVEKMKICGITIAKRNQSQADEELYDEIYRKAEKTVNRLRMRNISIKGKIIVIKSLIISLCQYFLSYTRPPDGFYKKMDKLIYQRFLWNNVDLIKRNALNQPIEKGGLKLDRLRDIYTACNASWIARLDIDEPYGWHNFMMNEINRLGGTIVLNGKIEEKSLDDVKSNIIHNMLQCWNSFHIENMNNDDYIKHMPIWSNRFITDKKNKGIQDPYLSKFIKCISQLYHTDGIMINFETAKRLGCKQNNFLNFMKVKKSIKPEIHRKMCRIGGYIPIDFRNNPHTEDNTDLWAGMTAGNDDIIMWNLERDVGLQRTGCTQKNLLIKRRMMIDISMNPFKQKISLLYSYDADDWESTFSRLNYISNSNVMRSEMWKSMHYIRFTNYELCLRNIPDYNTISCFYCNEPKQSKLHLMRDCISTINFYKHIENIFRPIFITPISDLTKLVGFNKLIQDNENEIQITLIIYCAQYEIFKACNKLKPPNYHNVISKLKYLEEIEKSIASRKNKLYHHNKKWLDIIACLDSFQRNI